MVRSVPWRLPVVSTEGRRPERRDLLSTISRLSSREGLYAPRGVYPEVFEGRSGRDDGIAICDSPTVERTVPQTLIGVTLAEIAEIAGARNHDALGGAPRQRRPAAWRQAEAGREVPREMALVGEAGRRRGLRKCDARGNHRLCPRQPPADLVTMRRGAGHGA